LGYKTGYGEGGFMKSKIILKSTILLIFFSYGAVFAQDPGNADTVRLANISGELADRVSMPVFLYNDEELTQVVIPLLLDGYSGWLMFDSVSYVGSRLADPTVLDERRVDVFGTDIFTLDSLLLYFSVSSGSNLPDSNGKLCDLWFTLHFGGPVSVDSLSGSPRGGLSLTDASKESFVPQFSSGLIDITCNYAVGDVDRDGKATLSDLVMLQKLYHYDEPPGGYPIFDYYGRADVNCDRRRDMRDLIHFTDWVVGGPPPCGCGTLIPPFYGDPGLPDTVWVESETLIVGISSTILVGITNDELLAGMAIDLEWDGSAVLGYDWQNTEPTPRIDTMTWLFVGHGFADGINPDTFQFHGWRNPFYAHPLSPGRDAVISMAFIPQTPGTADFRIVMWRNGSESMLVTEDYPAILPAFYGGHVTVIPYLTGDPNHDGLINSADVAYLINYLFVSGPAPNPYLSGDATCDGIVNAADVVYLLNYLFVGGPPPHC
jgi:hypothetical protein